MWISALLILLIMLQQSALLPRFHAFRVHCHYVFNWLNIKRWELVLGFSSELCATSSVTLISENEPVNQPQINFNYESLNESVKSSRTWRVMKVQGQRPSSYTQQRLKCDLSNLSIENCVYIYKKKKTYNYLLLTGAVKNILNEQSGTASVFVSRKKQ